MSREIVMPGTASEFVELCLIWVQIREPQLLFQHRVCLPSSMFPAMMVMDSETG